MGYFSELSMMQGQGHAESSPKAEPESSAFEEETFDELPVPARETSTHEQDEKTETLSAPAEESSSLPADEPADEEAPAEEEPDEEDEDEACEDDTSDEEPSSASTKDAASDTDEEKRRAEHEAAEAKRKAEWEARQAEKKRAEQEQLDRLAAMNDDEVVSASMQRGQHRYGKTDAAQYEGMCGGVYPDQMPGGYRFCASYHAPAEVNDPLLPVYQPQSVGLHSGRTQSERDSARARQPGIWL